MWTNAPELDSTYNGTDISLDKRLSNGWMMTGGVSIGRPTVGRATTTSTIRTRRSSAEGIVGNDTPFSFRLSGLYELPFGIQMSGTFQHQKGFPELTQVSVGSNTVALTQGTTSVTVEPRGTTRLPDLNQLDMSFRKVFRVGRQGVSAAAGYVQPRKLGNDHRALDVLGTSYGAVNGIQRGRLIKFGMHVDW